MFKIFVNDGNEEAPTDDIFYIIGKEGIFLRKKLGILDSIIPVDNISILNSVDISARLYIPKIPIKIFANMYKFFVDVYNKYQSEAVLLIFYNEETKKYKVISPKQEVSSASMKYDRKFTIKNYTMIGDIHSHGSMSAFHSSVDDADEESFDGLHITLGHILKDEISISASIVINGTRFLINPLEYIEGINKVEKKYSNILNADTITTLYRNKNEDIELLNKRNEYDNKINNNDKHYTFPIDITNYKGVPEWIDQVTKSMPKFLYTENQFMMNHFWNKFDYENINIYNKDPNESNDPMMICPYCRSKFFTSDFKTECPFCGKAINQEDDNDITKMISKIVLEAQKIREESYDITKSNEALEDLFIDHNDFYTKSINEAVDDAIESLGYNKELSTPIYLLIKYNWNEIQDWSNEHI